MSAYVYVDKNERGGRGGFIVGPDGRPTRKPVQRRVIDYTGAIITHMQRR
eukprot:CAMPEP_0183813730 /NCGR_PEP_ID=MMETSP0803_2-20130417/53627_1 /TAXON_ID=195967 /ORGANISM="Crustomastix stigmata, Strain CCMP3273" /LENGTH=49 /DNA_ID= /DNA_START= /DNA_END= /DNA_ORIENTATION=